ncbi:MULTISPECIES: helix-turn-helix transcriptional regulator [unclassified Streptomyces]|uniref:helix-turn-helix transcriptional regulator n=1 Tax=unclassified Streptomyces TaxID=2593676 RepID=UPI002442CABE|nr:helix-turn-helix transcriptional regulator [Streptomyces sp. DH41]MDG9728171.1 helix-turn-helix transcriptional regulator [Streptomyces sp. DH41]
MQSRGELGDFLRSRRARIRPEDVGYASGSGLRRVPGLRREELAHLAGVSIDYYVRLEQGRNRGVSDTVLGAVAAALRLDEDERAHLFRLARPQKPEPDTKRTAPEEAARPGVRRLLDWITAPALAMGRRMDVLAWNRPLCALITDFAALPVAERNLCRLHLLNDEIGSRYPDREMIAREAVGHLRIAASRFPEDPELWRLVEELNQGSEEFRRHWQRHTVRTKSHGLKRIDHPEAGPLTLSYEITHFPQDPELSLLVYTAAPGTPEEEALRVMAKA